MDTGEGISESLQNLCSVIKRTDHVVDLLASANLQPLLDRNLILGNTVDVQEKYSHRHQVGILQLYVSFRTTVILTLVRVTPCIDLPWTQRTRHQTSLSMND
jgi:hypothetical protein